MSDFIKKINRFKVKNCINLKHIVTTYYDEVTAAFLSDLDKSVAGHVLHAFVRFVHEFKQFIDDRFEEFPVGAQKTGILSDDVHNVRRDHRLVILPSLLFAQPQQVLNERR